MSVSAAQPGGVLLTGASGFLGRAVVQAAIRSGLPVRCVARPGRSEQMRVAIGVANESGVVVEGSLYSDDDCRSMLQGCSAVIHLAAAKSGHPSYLFANSVTPTRVLAKAAAAAGIKRFVHISSLGVYAPPSRRHAVVSETTPLDPRPHDRDAYSFAKVVQEQVVWEASRHTGMPVVVVRPGVIYGPGSTYVTARVGLGFSDFMCVMGGRHPLPYTFVHNCADAIIRSALQPDVDGEAFNIIDDELPTGVQLIAEARARGRRFRKVRIPAYLVPSMAGAYEWLSGKVPGLLPKAITRYRARAQWTPVVYSNQKAKRMLGWQPVIGLRDALQASDPS